MHRQAHKGGSLRFHEQDAVAHTLFDKVFVLAHHCARGLGKMKPSQRREGGRGKNQGDGRYLTVVIMRFYAHAATPLAVNLNHPFMNSEPMGEAKVLVRMSNGSWIEPGEHRVRTVPEELLGGHNLVQDTDDYPILGHFVAKSEKGPTLVRHLALIDQAIALRDAVNDVPDPIVGARGREKQETGLLERSWLEEETEVEVESPLVSFFRGKD